MSITPKQDICLKAIKKLTKGDVPPTFREIAAHLGMGVGGAYRMVTCLSDRGYLTFDRNQPRSIRIIERRAPGGRLDEMPTDALLTLRGHCDAVLRERMAGRARP